MQLLPEPEEIMYFDSQGISRFVNQITNYLPDIITRERQTSRETYGSLDLGADIGAIFTKFLPGFKTSLKGERKQGGSQKVTENYNTTLEQNYLHLVDQLDKSHRLERNLYKAWLNALTHDKNGFFKADINFLPEPVPSGDWIATANKRKILLLTDAERQFRMGMGLKNIIGTDEGVIHPVSHLALRLKHMRKLRVFGKIEGSKYIKPYCVSWF